MQSNISTNHTNNLVTLTGVLGKIVVNKEVQNQIDFLHAKTTGKEWGGVFTYTAEGNISNLKDMVFTILNIYVMDVGTYAHTGYSYDGLSKLYKTIPNTDLDVRIGTIHTHHNMGAFFSGEDLQEIANNASIYDYYLCLVVDTKGTYKAKVGIPTTEKTTVAFIKDGNGGTYEIKVKSSKSPIYVMDVEIDNIMPDISVPAWFNDRFNEVNVVKPLPYRSWEEPTGYWDGYQSKFKSPTTYVKSDPTIDFILEFLDVADIVEAVYHNYTKEDLEDIEFALSDIHILLQIMEEHFDTTSKNFNVVDTLKKCSKLLKDACTSYKGVKNIHEVTELIDKYAREYSSQI